MNNINAIKNKIVCDVPKITHDFPAQQQTVFNQISVVLESIDYKLLDDNTCTYELFKTTTNKKAMYITSYDGNDVRLFNIIGRARVIKLNDIVIMNHNELTEYITHLTLDFERCNR